MGSVAVAEIQLSVLLALGIDINYRDSSGLNVVHYILSKHLIGHIYFEPNDLEVYPKDDMVIGIEKLYLVERAGADFTHQFEHRTPLQAFRYGIDRVYQTPVDSLNLGDPPRHNELSELVRMLEHKEQTGHLPQPYLGSKFNGGPREYFEDQCDVCDSKQNTMPEGADTVSYENSTNLVPSRRPPLPPQVSSDADHCPDNASVLPEADPRLIETDADIVCLNASIAVADSPMTSSQTSTPRVVTNRNNSSSNIIQNAAVLLRRRSSQKPNAPSAGPRYLQPTKSSKQKERSRYKEI